MITPRTSPSLAAHAGQASAPLVHQPEEITRPELPPHAGEVLQDRGVSPTAQPNPESKALPDGFLPIGAQDALEMPPGRDAQLELLRELKRLYELPPESSLEDILREASRRAPNRPDGVYSQTPSRIPLAGSSVNTTNDTPQTEGSKGVSELHTPGPWMVEKHPNGSYGIFQCDCDFQVGEAFNRQLTKEETEANAHLIAASPDLLEALKRILEYTAEMDGHEDWPPLYVAATAAIAKAKGE